jgi:hypothetical protein
MKDRIPSVQGERDGEGEKGECLFTSDSDLSDLSSDLRAAFLLSYEFLLPSSS